MTRRLASCVLMLCFFLAVGGRAVEPDKPKAKDVPVKSGPKVVLPPSIAAEVGKMSLIVAQSDGVNVEWWSPNPEISFTPSSELKDSKRCWFVASKDGSFTIIAYTAVEGVPSQQSKDSMVAITVGVPPGPGPAPGPGPTPPDPPDPFSGDKISAVPAGFRVLIVRDWQSKDPKERVVLDSVEMRAYMDSHCIKGVDGKADWRIWNQDTVVTNMPVMWQKVMAMPRASVPWVIIGNGKVGYSGPLPVTSPADAINLMKKFGGP